MQYLHASVWIALSLLACKREPAGESRAALGSGSAALVPGASAGSAPAPAAPATWYRAVVRAEDGIEAPFFFGVPAPGAPGQAVIRVGSHEVRADATFDGTTVKMPLPVHLTAVEATLAPDGTLRGTFSTTWRAWGASALPIVGAKVDAATPAALATVATDAPPLDLGAPRTYWQLQTKESGEAKLAVDQEAPGVFTALLYLDNGNIIYLAGNGRGAQLVLGGFDGTSGYRLELALDAKAARATGKLYGGHRLDWREELTAARGDDFAIAIKARATQPDAKIGLRGPRELVPLQHGPVVIEIGGSWCSTCRNAAPFLGELYREYHPRGLDMISLLYEFTDDPDIDARQAQAFKDGYQVEWPVIPVLGGVEDLAEIMPSGLTDVDPAGFPLTLFLGPDRTLIAMHAGFPAKDSPEEFKRVAAQFRANIENLLSKYPRK